MVAVKVRVGDANQSRSLGKVAFTCPTCAQREGAYATLYWRVRRLAGIPIVSGSVGTLYRCAVCDAETKSRPPAGVAPPFMHRFGGLVVLAVVAAAGAIALKLATPDPLPQVSEATRVQLDALRTRVSKAGLVEVTADIECRKVVDIALKQAVPNFWYAAPVVPTDPIVADDLPVVVDEPKDVAPEFMPKRACKHVKPQEPFLFVAPGDDEPKRVAELTRKVEIYETEIAKLVPPDRFVYVEAECLDEKCGARAALVTRDGALLALSAVKLPAKIGDEGYEARFRRALGDAIHVWAKQHP